MVNLPRLEAARAILQLVHVVLYIAHYDLWEQAEQQACDSALRLIGIRIEEELHLARLKEGLEQETRVPLSPNGH